MNKPPDILAHPNQARDQPRSLIAAPFDPAAEAYTWSESPTGAPRGAWLLHRLDAATSGVVLLAADAAIATAVREAFAARQVHKRYVAIVLGHPRERRALWRDTMQVERGKSATGGGGARAREAKGAGGLVAESAMRVMRLIPGPPALAVIELEPHTGRTHQLRHQCAKRRLPILGDQTYGNFRLNRELARKFGTARLFLHARAIDLDLPLGGQRLQFNAEAPLPPEFARFLPR